MPDRPIQCLHELFERQADIRPDAPALICFDRSFSYREVEDQSNRIAHFLREKGITTGSMVGIYFRRSELPHFALLGILKAGAGYVPIDPAYPEERIKHICSDASITALLSQKDLGENARMLFSGPVFLLDDEHDAIGKQLAARPDPAAIGLDASRLSYIMYTSGSTGKPKGVMTEHRNIVGFVQAFKHVCALTPDDRVYQGFSFGFDGSVEEIWMAFAHGAALVVGSDDIAKLGTETAAYLTEKKVTYFSTVPTFLTMIAGDLPTVKLLVVSGEACPQELVDRWAVNGRRMLNVYGPTETTVNTTAAECAAGKPVTIGKPLAGYEVHILDERLLPVPDGERGELYIGGPGLSRGYMQLPETTAKAFIATPAHIRSSSPRLYKTGDLVLRNPDGELQFFGRIDFQVKIRGYRIEIAEIEAVLREHPSIAATAVKPVQRGGMTELAAFVVKKDGALLARDEVLDLLKKKLPAYMIPAFLDEIDTLPLLSSGKTDRKRLPEPATPLVRTNTIIAAPETPAEASILEIWKGLFNLPAISTGDDFFLDLGGYSLIAAQAASLVRAKMKREIAIRDVYRYPTIKKLAAFCDTMEPASERETEPLPQGTAGVRSGKSRFHRIAAPRRWLCGFLQAISLACLSGAGMGLAYASLMVYYGLRQDSLPVHFAIGLAVAAFLVGYPAMLSFSIIAKWLIIGKYRPGNYQLWSFYYFRWWLVTRIQRISGAALLAGTPFMAMYCRLMGAKIGPDSTLNTSWFAMFDLLTIGRETCIGFETQLLGYRVEDGLLKIGPITIGDHCFIGIQSVIGINTSMGDGAKLDDLSMLPDDDTIPSGQSRIGSPAQKGTVTVPDATGTEKKPMHPVLFGLGSLVSIYAIELFLITAALPSAVILYLAFQQNDWLSWIVYLAVAIPLFEITFWMLLIVVKTIILPRTSPGIYPIRSGYYLRKWLIDSLLLLSRLLTLPLYTTLYILPLFRLLGMRLGARAELSVVAYLSPDLAEIGEESFFADGSIIGGVRLHRGVFQQERNRIGKRSFVGNSAVLPVGHHLGDNGLIGVLSKPPEGVHRTEDGSEWLGSPSFQLPNRKKIAGFGDAVTYKPTRMLFFGRLCIDALRIIIPSCIEIAGIVGLIVLVNALYGHSGLPLLCAALPCIGAGIALGMVFCAIMTKNILMGVYAPEIKPLWSPYVWLNEAVNGVYESVAAPILSLLMGTPFLSWFLRLFGMKVGKRLFCETVLFGEFDCVEIGDDAALNADAIIQNHLFEDRIFKSSRLRIGDECAVGNLAVVLYDTEMQRGASIGPLSLLMKGEQLPAFTEWEGIPVKAKKAPGSHGGRNV